MGLESHVDRILKEAGVPRGWYHWHNGMNMRKIARVPYWDFSKNDIVFPSDERGKKGEQGYQDFIVKL